jgi:hypothetical protein
MPPDLVAAAGSPLRQAGSDVRGTIADLKRALKFETPESNRLRGHVFCRAFHVVDASPLARE